MKLGRTVWIVGIGAASVLTSAESHPWVSDGFSLAQHQFRHAFGEIEYAIEHESDDSRERRERRGQGPLVSPRSLTADGKLQMVPSADWTSGFFPGSLWLVYEYTDDAEWRERAEAFTMQVADQRWNDRTHDMGFKMFCSFGNGLLLTGEPSYREILIQSADTLITRFNPVVGAIRSWDHNRDKWDYPVIIDNMLNLELLFWASTATGNPVYAEIATAHAQTTLRHHFREDFSTWHVLDYDPETGEVEQRHTHQGYSHDSSWSRGQAWALYGFVMTYRETGLPEFLEVAERVAHFIFTHPNLPEDLVPYWDFDAPGIPDEPRDTSAAAVIASALYELSAHPTKEADRYRDLADTMVRNLLKTYASEPSENRGFLLDHGTGHFPHGYEIDVPLAYGDYYLLEALLRKEKLEDGRPLF